MSNNEHLIKGSFSKFVMNLAYDAEFTYGMQDELKRLLDAIALKTGVQPADLRMMVIEDKDGEKSLELVGRERKGGKISWIPISKMPPPAFGAHDPSIAVTMTSAAKFAGKEGERVPAE